MRARTSPRVSLLQQPRHCPSIFLNLQRQFAYLHLPSVSFELDDDLSSASVQVFDVEPVVGGVVAEIQIELFLRYPFEGLFLDEVFRRTLP